MRRASLLLLLVMAGASCTSDEDGPPYLPCYGASQDGACSGDLHCPVNDPDAGRYCFYRMDCFGGKWTRATDTGCAD